MNISVGEIEDNNDKYKKFLKKGATYKVARGVKYCTHSGSKITKGDTVKFLGFYSDTRYMRFETNSCSDTYIEEDVILTIETTMLKNLKEFLNSHPLDKETQDD